MYHQRFKTIEERFWEKVDKISTPDYCWEWIPCQQRNRGSFRMSKDYDGKVWDAPKASYEINVAHIPDGMWILHHCDNGRCVRPEHLYLGTIQDNVRDAVERKRFASGQNHGTYTKPEAYMKNKARHERHNKAKITMKIAEEIRNKYKTGSVTQTQLGSEYSICQTVVSAIVNDKLWINNR